MQAVDCPDGHTLERLLLGRLSPSAADQLADHLEHCPRCVVAVNELRVQDTLPELVRASAALALTPVGRTEATLIERLRGLPAPRGMQDVAACLRPPEQPGELGRLGPYRVLGLLGLGGMGLVFHAEDPLLGRPVALKTLRQSVAHGSARERFLREARAAAAVTGDHLVAVHQVGEDRGVPYLAMQLLEGETLEQHLQREKRLPVSEIVRIGRECADGLAVAHTQGLIHRDVKPANIWLEAQTGRVKLLDFGLARCAGDPHVTQPGTIVGTPAYMAPEQARGREVDERADLFSLGCVLYRLGTGTTPFRGDDLTAWLTSLAVDQPTPPHRLNPALPAPLSALILSLLAHNPADRPPSAAAVSAALRDLERAGPGQRHRRRGLLAAAVLCLGVLLWLVGQVVTRNRDGNGEDTRYSGSPGGTALTEAWSRLDPAAIPVKERAAWHPKELVAVLGEQRGWHAGSVQSVAWSPDGRLIVSGGDDGVVRLWDPLTLRERAFLHGHVGAVMAVAIAPDGKSAATAGVDGMVRLWDLAGKDPSQRAVVRGHKGRVLAVAFALKDHLLASAGDDGVRLWRLSDEEPRQLAVLARHRGAVLALAFQPHGKALAAAESDGSVRLWHLTGPTPGDAVVLRDSGGTVSGLAFSPGGDVLAAVDPDVVVLWDVGGTTPRRRSSSRPRRGPLHGLTFAADGRTLVTGGYIGHVWDLTGNEPTERAVFTQPPVAPALVAVALAPDGKTLVCGGEDGTLSLWAMTESTPRQRHAAVGHTGWVNAVLFSPDGNTLASAGTDGTIRLWTPTARGVVEKVLTASVAPVMALAFTPDGQALFAGEHDGTVRRWELSGEPRARVVCRKSGYLGNLALAPDGRLLAVGWDDRPLSLWDVGGAVPTELTLPASPHGAHWALAFSPDGRTLAAGGKPLATHLWDLSKDGPTIGTVLPGMARSAAFSPDGNQLALGYDSRFGSEAGYVERWRLDGGRPEKQSTWQDNAGAVAGLAFAPDGASVLTANLGGRLTWWNAADGRKRGTFAVPGMALGVAVAPDGRHAASAHNSGSVFVWRLPRP